MPLAPATQIAVQMALRVSQNDGFAITGYKGILLLGPQ
jgi:hypothetical protein